MNFIEHIFEPKKLLLVWQSPDCGGRRLVVGEIVRKVDFVSFRYLVDTEDFVRACEQGFTYYPAYRKLDRVYEDGVIGTFLRRLPPRKRGDFSKYLEQLRLPSDVVISDFALLGYSGAKLPGDRFSLIMPFDDIDTPAEFLIEVAGFQYRENVSINMLNVGDEVSFLPEPDNKWDKDAVKVIANGNFIGYVNRFHCNGIKRWLNQFSLDIHIERLNGTDGRPLVYLFLRVDERENLNSLVS